MPNTIRISTVKIFTHLKTKCVHILFLQSYTIIVLIPLFWVSYLLLLFIYLGIRNLVTTEMM